MTLTIKYAVSLCSVHISPVKFTIVTVYIVSQDGKHSVTINIIIHVHCDGVTK